MPNTVGERVKVLGGTDFLALLELPLPQGKKTKITRF